jgi:N-acyl-D-amino-acid deacylase
MARQGGQPRQPDYKNMHVIEITVRPNPSVADLALQRGVDPVEVMIDCALETGFDQFFMQFSARSMARDEAEMLTTLLHPRTVMTFSDSGAHVGLIMDSSIQTHLLAYWVRERQAISLEQGVRMITLVPAMAWGLADRGVLRPGCVADINVFDVAKVAPEMPTIVDARFQQAR